MSNKKKSIGIFFGRMHPIQDGHLEVIKKSLKEDDYTFVFIGSADKEGEWRNPLPVVLRAKLIREALKGEWINVFDIDDLSTEDDVSHEWGEYLEKEIKDWIVRQLDYNQKYGYDKEELLEEFDLKFYTGEGKKAWNSWFGKTDFIPVYINREEIANGISATKVREMILNDDLKYTAYTPKSVYDHREEIKYWLTRAKYIKEIKEGTTSEEKNIRYYTKKCNELRHNLGEVHGKHYTCHECTVRLKNEK